MLSFLRNAERRRPDRRRRRSRRAGRPGGQLGHRQGRRALQGHATQRHLPRPAGLPRHREAVAGFREGDRHQGQLRGRALREHPREGSAELQRPGRSLHRAGRSRLDRRIRGERLDRADRQVQRRRRDHRSRPQPQGLLPAAARRVRLLGRQGLRPAVRQLLRPAVLQQVHAEERRLRQAAGDLGRAEGRLWAEAHRQVQEPIRLCAAIAARRDAIGRQLHAQPVAARRLAARQDLPLQPDEQGEPGGPRTSVRT